MATFTLKLDDEAFLKLAEAARRAGVTPERMAERVMETWLVAADDIPASTGVGEPARAWTDATDEGSNSGEDKGANPDLDEAGRSWSEVRPEFVALIDMTFGKAE